MKVAGASHDRAAGRLAKLLGFRAEVDSLANLYEPSRCQPRPSAQIFPHGKLNHRELIALSALFTNYLGCGCLAHSRAQ